MTVISDTTPLHYLVLIGHAKILPALFGKVVIPAAVASKLQRARTPGLVRAWMSSPPPWLDIHPTTPSTTEDLNHLGAGPVIGTLRVLDEAAHRRLIDLPEVLAALRKTTFYISPDLL